MLGESVPGVTAAIVPDPTDNPLDRLQAAYRLAHRVAGTATVVLIGAATDLCNERGVKLVRTMAHRHFSAAVDAARTGSAATAAVAGPGWRTVSG